MTVFHLLFVKFLKELMFLETSALTGENVEESFLKCSRAILNKIELGKQASPPPPPHSMICPFPSHPIPSHLFQSHPIPSYSIPFLPFPSHLFPSHLISSYPIPSLPISPYLIPSLPSPPPPISSPLLLLQ